MTLSVNEVRQLLDEAQIAPKKSLGQNFVIDPNTVRRIARLAEVGHGDKVLEIGAGLGSLTLALVETGANVLALETDRALIPLLRSTVGSNVEILQADVRNVSLDKVLEGSDWHLVANLPYNIATSIVLQVLDEVPAVSHLLVMVQKEAGERLAASAGDKAYGAVSVRVAMRANASIVGHISPSVFYPKPKVSSTLVAIERCNNRFSSEVEQELISILRTAFGQRRKMLRKSLKGTVDEGSIKLAGIDPTSRPEQLDLGAWVSLAEQSIDASS